ncbi:hypothetical protein DPMN_103212 [Dreissena polymorpha]|uniref:Uncharacterized protein n=1 Tax=Dreissena polymorpha TaxID=45954 RepID=A0A9D4H9M2_DREPO|nr:hypothetical protein DPMN_103212 [Dreissena polymorpha]
MQSSRPASTLVQSRQELYPVCLRDCTSVQASLETRLPHMADKTHDLFTQRCLYDCNSTTYRYLLT